MASSNSNSNLHTATTTTTSHVDGGHQHQQLTVVQTPQVWKMDFCIRMIKNQDDCRDLPIFLWNVVDCQFCNRWDDDTADNGSNYGSTRTCSGYSSSSHWEFWKHPGTLGKVIIWLWSVRRSLTFVGYFVQQGAQIIQTADGQAYIYQPVSMDGSSSQQGINGSLIPLNTTNAGNVNQTGASITIPQNMVGGTNIVRFEGFVS